MHPDQGRRLRGRLRRSPPPAARVRRGLRRRATNPGRREPTQIVDGNQVSMEYRFFTPSRPSP
ncbi:aminopeptidase, partial [Streptomyces asoensis]